MAVGKRLSCDVCAVSLDLPAALPLFVLRVHFMYKCNILEYLNQKMTHHLTEIQI